MYAGKRKLEASSVEEKRYLDERLIMSPYLCNQVLIERNWRSLHHDVARPEDVPERFFTERFPAIFHENVWFNFDWTTATSNVFFFPVMRERIWVSAYGGAWQCEQTMIAGPLCRFDVDRTNE